MIDRSKTSILAYGQLGTSKSTQVRYLAEYVWEKYKKRTRLIATDRGSLWAPCQDLVDEGIVIPVEFPTGYEFNPFAIMRKFRRGWWPSERDERGIAVIHPPTAFVENKGGKESIRYQTNTKWRQWNEGENDTENIGAVVVDSLSRYASSFMSDAKQKNIRLGEGVASVRSEEGETMGSNTEGHYGDAHTEILDLVAGIQSLPVPFSMFTALEGSGEVKTEIGKRQALGPLTVGKALNHVLPSCVNVCFHLERENRSVKAWYQEHPSRENPKVNWPAKCVMTPAQTAKFWQKYPKGYIDLALEKGIKEFLEFWDSLNPIQNK